MAGIWAITLLLLLQGCGAERNATGCERWESRGREVCCTACHSGNRLVRRCGMDPKTLCTPCEKDKYTVDLLAPSCLRCTQCVGKQVTATPCSTSADTKCGCKDGHTCGDAKCSFCMRTCGAGEEPHERFCRPCPKGTFNAQIHQKCKPWSTQCPYPGQVMMDFGDAVSDIKCVNSSFSVKPKPADPEDDGLPLFIFVGAFMSLLVILTILFISLIVRKISKRQKTLTITTKKGPIVSTPTDDPRTLIAIECSFHEAEQEQGSSSESLASKDSEDQLLP